MLDRSAAGAHGKLVRAGAMGSVFARTHEPVVPARP